MPVEPELQQCDGQLLKTLFSVAVVWLEANVEEVNRMNVFPVPDGDTGSNMLATVQQAQTQMMQVDEDHAGAVMNSIAQGALRGARGNSGTILSMLFRGFADAVKDHAVLNTELMIRASQSGVDYAYATVGKVMEPVEGTILTVARETAQAIQTMTDPDLHSLLDHAVLASRESLERTPDLLPILKQANVVDSGGLGLVYLLEGMQRQLSGQMLTQPDVSGLDRASQPVTQREQNWENALIPEDAEGYGYDVQFLMIGQNLNIEQVRQDISAMGWSPLIDGDESLIKVHIHVHNPGEPLGYAIQAGAELDDIVVENMQLQYQQYVTERQSRETQEEKQTEGVAVVTVVNGDGLREVFENYQATRIILGGQTMNPSTEDFLKQIHSLTVDEIILLPNNKNILLAAQQAASEVQNKQIRVVPSRNIPQGIAALLTFADLHGGEHALDDLVNNMEDAMRDVVSCEVTRATRDTNIDDIRVREGQVIGLLNGKLVSAGDHFGSVIQQLFALTDIDEYELATFYYGDDVTAEQAETIIEEISEELDEAELDLELVYGGQALYSFLISIE